MPRGGSSKKVRSIESMPGSWRLKSYIMHRAGMTNKGGHWHKASGAQLAKVRKLGGVKAKAKGRKR